MSEPKGPLLAFENPPVIETVLGVQFPPLEFLSILHLGLYWSQIRDTYPQQQIQPPLDPTFEEFGRQPAKGPVPGLQLVPEPDVRCWFIDPSSTELIQVQKDRFIRNWRRVKDSDAYPHYESLKPKFRADWEGFCSFLSQEKLGTPEVNQCEVTYINHIEIGKGYESYGEAHKVVTVLSRTSSRPFLPDPEMVHLDVRYLMPDKKGRLYVTLQPAIRRRDGREVLQLVLSARGRPASSRLENVLNWFDMGHEWIVRGFADITTREMQDIWRRTL